MSEEAKAAIINVGTFRQGAAIPPRTPQTVIDELLRLGLIGPKLGLTRKGSIRAEWLSMEYLNSEF